MATYQTDPIPLATAIDSYTPTTDFLVAITDPEAEVNVGAELADKLAALISITSPVDKIVEAYTLLKPHIAEADEGALKIIAGCGELLFAYNWHGKRDGALAARDLAVARLNA